MDSSKLLDLALTTISKYPDHEYTNALIGQSYIFRTFFGSLKPRDMTGLDVKFNAIITGDAGDTDTDATVTGFGVWDGGYDVIPVIQAEYMRQGTAKWAQYIWNWSITEKEIIQNAGKQAYIDLGVSKVEGAMTRFANILETHFWSTVGYQHEDDDAPWILGPEYYITDDGYHFNDSGGSSGTEVAGIDPTDSDLNDLNTSVNRWRNQFNEITAANELLDGMDDLYIDTKFEAPPDVKMNTEPQYKKFKIVFNKNGFKAWKRLMRRLDEPFDPAAPSFNNTKVEMADRMATRSDGYNQGFFFNLASWQAYVASGKNMSKDPKITPENQPGVRFQRGNFWPALCCKDRRNQGKIFGFGDELIES